jgi:hypothetical protein
MTSVTPIMECSTVLVLADMADFVIGVDPHKHTHTAVIVEAATGKKWPVTQHLLIRRASLCCSGLPSANREPLLDYRRLCQWAATLLRG